MQPLHHAPRSFAALPDRRLIFAVLAVSILASSACSRTPSIASAPAVTATPAAKTLGEFTLIENTDFLIAPIRDVTDSASSYTDYERSGYWGPVNNYVFLDRRTQTFQQLLPTNDYVIARAYALEPPSAGTETPIIQGWLYSVVKADTDGDKELSLTDKITLSLSDAGGARYTEVLIDVDDVYGRTLSNSTTLLIIYRKGEHKYMTSLDLSSYAVIATTELAFLGPEVK